MVKNISDIRSLLSLHGDELRREYPIKSLRIFGSYARGEQKKTSDIDILVEFSRPVGLLKFLKLENELASLLGHRVDLVTKKSLETADRQKHTQRSRKYIRDEFLDFLRDIFVEIKNIEEFTSGYDYKEFISDKKTINAVIRSLEIIGEASKKIPRNIRIKYKNIPWKEMSGMRDKLIHEYFGVDLEVVWLVATKELPLLEKEIERIFASEK